MRSSPNTTSEAGAEQRRPSAVKSKETNKQENAFQNKIKLFSKTKGKN